MLQWFGLPEGGPGAHATDGSQRNVAVPPRGVLGVLGLQAVEVLTQAGAGQGRNTLVVSRPKKTGCENSPSKYTTLSSHNSAKNEMNANEMKFRTRRRTPS